MKFEKVFLQMDFEDEAYNSYFYKQQKSGGQQKSGMPGGLGAPDVSFFKLFIMQQRSFLALCMLLQIHFLIRFILFNPKSLS